MNPTRPSSRTLRVLGVGLILVFAGPIHAQDAHYWNNQYGTRAEHVGGLVVGGVLDLSTTYYNPGARRIAEKASAPVKNRSHEIVTTVDGVSFHLEGPSVVLDVSVPQPGPHTARNAAGVIALLTDDALLAMPPEVAELRRPGGDRPLPDGTRSGQEVP